MTSATSSARMACEFRARADIYSFLAAVFDGHPTEEQVSALGGMAAELGIPCPQGLSTTALDQDYMDLFVVPGPRYVAPYESVFRDRWLLPATLKRGSNPAETGSTIKGLLMGPSTLAVRQCYLDSGLLPEQDLPDHISNELRFLAYLCAREADAPDSEVRRLASVREQFRQQHVIAWLRQLRRKIEDRDRLGYYRAAVAVTEAVVREEADAVEDEEVTPTAPPFAPVSTCPWHREAQHSRG